MLYRIDKWTLSLQMRKNGISDPCFRRMQLVHHYINNYWISINKKFVLHDRWDLYALWFYFQRNDIPSQTQAHFLSCCTFRPVSTLKPLPSTQRLGNYDKPAGIHEITHRTAQIWAHVRKQSNCLFVCFHNTFPQQQKVADQKSWRMISLLRLQMCTSQFSAWCSDSNIRTGTCKAH